MWEAPDDVGGDTIKGSIVRARETDSLADPLEFPVNAFSAVLTGLKSATAYSISVVSVFCGYAFQDSHPLMPYFRLRSTLSVTQVPQV